MIVNPTIKKVFEEISKSTVEYMKTPDVEREYLLKLLRVFKRLNEDEQLYLFRVVFEHIHFRNILTDPDNIVQIHNIKLRTMTYMFILAVLLVAISAALLKTNSNINAILTHLGNVFKIIF